MGKKQTIHIRKSDDFPFWYNEVIKVADIVDTRYPLKGCHVWKPYGYKALKLMMALMERELEENGHEEAYFPSLIPMSVFSKEADFLQGFGGESLRITHVGEKKLKEELILRPTSETVMYEMFSLWIKGKKDLPIRIYQTVNVFRYETKQTRPLLRVREIVKFKEAHTIHATYEEAEKQVEAAKQIYAKFFNMMLLPYKVLKTPSWDTFAGAEYNFDFITVLPDGKALELGSVINLGQKFAKAFNIQFMDEEGKMRHPYQTCYGISERSLGAVIAIHGDDKGIRFPSCIAPIQVVIVPIIRKGNDEPILMAKNLEKILKKILRVKIDDSDVSPGEKFYLWEAKGVPLRIEIGQREVEENNVVVVIRANSERKVLPLDEHLSGRLLALLKEHDGYLLREAQERFNKEIHRFTTLGEGKEYVLGLGARDERKQPGLVGFGWCGEQNCGRVIEKSLEMPALGYEKIKDNLTCAYCGKRAMHILYFGRTY